MSTFASKHDSYVAAYNSEKLRWLTEERLDKFLSSTYWTDINFNREKVYSKSKTVALTAFAVPGLVLPVFVRSRSYSQMASASPSLKPCRAHTSPVLLEMFFDQDGQRTGSALRLTYRTNGRARHVVTWLFLRGCAPRFVPLQEVHLVWDTDSEGMVWVDGQPQQGATSDPSLENVRA